MRETPPTSRAQQAFGGSAVLNVIRASWALYIGILLLMIGNALQGSLVGVRAEIEGFDPQIFGFVSSAYFIGLMLGAWLTPRLLRRVGHVRVFAALASLISAAFIIFAALVDPVAWFLCRLVVGIGFAGVYIVSESWINDSSDNTTRGAALGVYMLTQMGGVMVGQALLNVGDPAGFELFVLMSVLVSVSFAPILLSVQPAPVFDTSKPMSLRELYEASPLGSIGMLLLGGTMAAMFGMGALYATRVGMSVP
ncbi:MAG: MFS transporter, partial [Pseudomonadota bacterium]